MKRILLITDIFPPDIGGPATFTDLLGHALTKRGYTVRVICLSSVQKESIDYERPFKVIRIGRGKKWQFFRIVLRMCLEMLFTGKIFVNGLEYHTFFASCIVGRFYLIKIVGDYVWEFSRSNALTDIGIDSFQKESVEIDLIKKIKKERMRYLGRARTIIVPSLYLKKMAMGWGIKDEKIKIIHNGIEESVFKDFFPQLRKGSDLKTVFFGRFTNWKGIETILLAISGTEGITLDILGEGAEFPMLSDLCRQLKIESKVNFLGKKTKEALYKHIALAHVAVLVSSYEGFSHALLEACSVGLPCISSLCGGNLEIIKEGYNGLLVPARDPEALRKAMILLRDDENKRYQMAIAAKKTVGIFNFKETLAQTVELLDRK